MGPPAMKRTQIYLDEDLDCDLRHVAVSQGGRRPQLFARLSDGTLPTFLGPAQVTTLSLELPAGLQEDIGMPQDITTVTYNPGTPDSPDPRDIQQRGFEASGVSFVFADSGGWIALLKRDDRDHRACVDRYAQLSAGGSR